MRRLLTNDETAELMGLRPQTLREWRVRGKGPAYMRLGSGVKAPVRYSQDDIEAWLAQHQFPHTTAETAGKEKKRR